MDRQTHGTRSCLLLLSISPLPLHPLILHQHPCPYSVPSVSVPVPVPAPWVLHARVLAVALRCEGRVCACVCDQPGQRRARDLRPVGARSEERGGPGDPPEGSNHLCVPLLLPDYSYPHPHPHQHRRGRGRGRGHGSRSISGRAREERVEAGGVSHVCSCVCAHVGGDAEPCPVSVPVPYWEAEDWVRACAADFTPNWRKIYRIHGKMSTLPRICEEASRSQGILAVVRDEACRLTVVDDSSKKISFFH
jgi:hypothetical protein